MVQYIRFEENYMIYVYFETFGRRDVFYVRVLFIRRNTTFLLALVLCID